MSLKALPSILLTILVFNIVPIGQTFADEPSQRQISQLSQQKSVKISEQAVQELLDKIILATQERKIDDITKYFAPFIYSEITIKTDNLSETINLNGLEENRQFIDQRLQQIQSSESLFEDSQIRISEDETMAFIERDRLVNITNKEGKKFLISSEAEARLAIIEGELRIIAIDETAQVVPRPD